MPRHPARARTRLSVTALLLAGLLALIPACGGGGGGGGGSGGGGGGGGAAGGGSLNPNTQFFLTGAFLARPIPGPDGALDPGQPLVNPASLYEVDPLTGVALPGFPQPLSQAVSLTQLSPVSFEQVLDPLTPQIPLVPRNAVLVLEFSKPPALESLNLDDSDPETPGQVNAASTIQVRTKNGVMVGARILPDPTDENRLVLQGVSPGSTAWVPTPLNFDTQGNAVEDPEGYLKVELGTGVGVFVSTDGRPFIDRPDKLGTDQLPFPFNPGNSQLDALVLQTEDGKVGFNGFLPDLSAPRIVRPVVLEGTVSSVFADELRDDSLPEPPNTTANGGLGEWANALLTVTSNGGALETTYVVETNVDLGGTAAFRIEAGTVFDPAVVPGDAYRVVRAEYFEPIPPPLPVDPLELARITVDPVNQPRDPDDPQDLLNSDLRYFVRVFDEFGVERTDVWDPTQGLFSAVPPRSQLRLSFSEGMDPASFLPYESFGVIDASVPADDPGFLSMRVGRVEASIDGREVTFVPFLEDQVEPTNSRFIGFGGTPSALRLTLRTSPSVAELAALSESASPDVLAQLVDLTETGVRTCTDLGGRGLGLPAALLDQSDPIHFLLAETSAGRGAFAPAIDFSVPFETTASADPDYGVIVHRFMGQPTTALFTPPPGEVSDEVTQGIEYYDYPAIDADEDGNPERRFVYGPTLLEVGLNVPGRLTGAPASTIEHLIDDFNKPARSDFASPNGEDFLISVGFGLSMPINSGYGARFQHVYRSGDASPSEGTFRGAVLDLVGLAWSPFNNQVFNTSLDGMEVLVGLSGVGRGEGPNTNQTNGIPADDDSGLVRHFDCNKLEWTDNCQLGNSDIFPITKAKLVNALDNQQLQTAVVKKGTPYAIQQGNLFTPANAVSGGGSFNQYLDFPQFNAGIDPIFGRDDVFSFPYDSTFPMLIEYNIEPNTQVPSQLNFFRFSPGILSSALPRFRVFSQGQHPTAYGVPNWTLNVGPGPYNGNQKGNFFAGEGGPLVEPGCLTEPIFPPDQNNGMPTIVPTEYILPPYVEGTNNLNQPSFDRNNGMIDSDDNSITAGCITTLPTPNSDPYMNWYFANGMLMNPLPNFTAYPGPTGAPPTQWYGYGVPAAAIAGLLGTFFQDPVDPCFLAGATGGSNQSNPPVASNEPGMTGAPARYGDNSRYYMMWKYRKRVSIIESPTIEATAPSGVVRYQRPIIDPPIEDVDAAASLRLEFRAGTLLDFSVPQLDSGYIDFESDSFEDDVSGLAADRTFVKFRASFGVAAGQTQPPTLETIVIPYEKGSP